MKVLEEAQGSAGKMACHNEADDKVQSLKVKKSVDNIVHMFNDYVEYMLHKFQINIRVLEPVAHDKKIYDIDCNIQIGSMG